MIVVVAPYSPIGLCDVPNLGAARKIEVVISVLAQLDPHIVLVNSAHNEARFERWSIGDLLVGGTAVTQVVPATLANRFIGKSLNTASASRIAAEVLRLGQPQLVWLYNGYAFESLFAVAISARAHCPIVLEFEDWHFARGRGFNIKPLIDYASWRTAMRRISDVYCVNQELASRAKPYGVPTQLLPGVVPRHLMEATDQRKPFQDEDGQTTVGYFGGLLAEKGVESILDIVPRLPSHIRFMVSGAGDLSGAFEAMSKRHPDRLCFLGQVEEKVLYRKIAECDVIVNPHPAISSMGNGVFPFKVIEAIASSRVLISTELPRAGLEDLLAPVRFYDGSTTELIQALDTARAQYPAMSSTVSAAASLARDGYSELALLGKIRHSMQRHQARH